MAGGSGGLGGASTKQILKPLPPTEPSDVHSKEEVVTPSGPAVPWNPTPFTVALSQHDSVPKR